MEGRRALPAEAMVSGTYIGLAESIELQLRVDIDGPRPLQKLSGDLFGVSPDARFYINSFLIDEPEITGLVEAETVVIRGSVSFSRDPGGSHSVEVTIPQPADPGDAAPQQAYVMWHVEQWGSLGFICSFTGPSFRWVVVESGFEEGSSLSTAYDTHSNPDRPAELPRKLLTVPRAYEEAGIQVFEGRSPALIRGWEAGLDARWSDAELHAAIESHFEDFRNFPQWRLFVLFVRRHEFSSYMGLMYDLQDAVQRQGCALFIEHPYLNTGTPAERARAALWASMHEIGHCFNLLHSFDKGPGKESKPDALSWMNYPFAYDKLAGKQEGSFWKDFPFQFTDDELLHLRHAELYSVVMGGLPFQTGAGAEYLEQELQEAATAADPAELSLRLEAKREFSFGEPVFVELSLRPPKAPGARISAHEELDPASRFVRILIKKPSGRVVQYKPLLFHDTAPAEKVFEADGLPSYDAIYLGYGKDGFYFSDPGEYQVRAVYLLDDGREVVSNLLALRVAPPAAGEEALVVSHLLGAQQGQAFWLGGSDLLWEGTSRLQELLLRQPTGALASHIHRVLGTNAGRSFKTISPHAPTINVREPDLDRAILHLSTCTRIDPAAERCPLDNITFREVGARLVKLQLEAGAEQEARTLVQKLNEYFGAQRLRPDVLQSIRASTESVLGADSTASDAPSGPTKGGKTRPPRRK